MMHLIIESVVLTEICKSNNYKTMQLKLVYRLVVDYKKQQRNIAKYHKILGISVNILNPN